MAGDTSTGSGSGNGLYPYKPSQVAAIIALGLFGISAIIHLINMIRKRTWFYTPLTVGAISMSPSFPPVLCDTSAHNLAKADCQR